MVQSRANINLITNGLGLGSFWFRRPLVGDVKRGFLGWCREGRQKCPRSL